MALRVGSRLEIGQRVAWLRKQADLTGRDAAHLLGIDDSGLFGRIENHGRSFDHERLVEIANAFSGRGQLIEDEQTLFHFMLFGGEVASVLRPQLRPVEAEPAITVIEGEGRDARRSARRSAAAAQTHKGYIRLNHSDLHRYVHEGEGARRNARKVA